MKTIGLLSGMMYHSGIDYYRIINDEVGKRLGGVHSAKVVMASVDFQEISDLQHANDWEELEILLSREVITNLSNVDIVLICTNTMNCLAEKIARNTKKQVLNIFDCVQDVVVSQGFKKVGLLGTKFTMQSGHYTKRLEYKGIEVIVPNEADMDYVHQTIYQDLSRPSFYEDLEDFDVAKKNFLAIIDKMKENGVEAVILGCTEIPLLIKEASIPVMNTTEIHAKAVVEFALDDRD